jgi:streptomycin 6-kinase
VIRAYELGHSEQDVRHRLDRLATELGLERERARGWALAQTLAWAWEDDEILSAHVKTARWLASA